MADECEPEQVLKEVSVEIPYFAEDNYRVETVA